MFVKITHTRWYVSLLCAGLAGAMLTSATPTPAQDDSARAATLIIAYKSAPKDRAAFRSWWRTSGVTRFARWRQQGVFADSRILFSSYAGAEYDALAIIDFRHFVDLQRWRTIETTSPGGLTPAALRYGAPAYAGIGDTLAHGAKAQTAAPTYLVTFYDVSADPAAYRSYVGGYVAPQMAGWMQAGALASYDMYVNENTAGAPWQSMLVLDYNGLEGLARRESVKTEVRHSLAANPQWKQLSDNKSEVRREKAVAEFELLSPIKETTGHE